MLVLKGPYAFQVHPLVLYLNMFMILLVLSLWLKLVLKYNLRIIVLFIHFDVIEVVLIKIESLVISCDFYILLFLFIKM